MLKFLFGLIFLCVGGLLGWIAYTHDNFCIICGSKSDSSSLNMNGIQVLLIEDLKLAAQNNELPEIWSQVSEVRYLYHSKKIEKALNKNPIVSVNKKGDKRLLVEFYDEPGDDHFILVQYNLIDVPSGNTVAEINRRLKLPETSKVKSTTPVLQSPKPKK